MTSSVLGIDTETGQRVEISQSARRQGLYIIGSTGQGKTGLIENLIIQDIKQGVGVCLLDPHGDLTRSVLARIPQERIDKQDVIYLDIAEEDYPFGLNFFTCDNPKSAKAVQKVVDQVIHIFEKLFDITRTTPLLIQYLRNCTHTLVVNPGYAMADIPVLLRNKACRRKLVANVTDPNVLGFWHDYEEMNSKEQREEREPILRRLEEFLQPLTRNIVGQAYSTIDLRKVMDERKILLVTLDPLLESVTSLIGSVLIALFLNAAYSRSDIEDVRKRKQFNLYADEFQRFATEDFATLLTEARKFGIATTIAHQARFQPGMTEAIRATSLQAANLVMFRITSQDANELAGNFDCTPVVTRKVLRQKTEPKYREWDETVWIEDGEALYKEAVAQYETHYEARWSELTQRLTRAEKQEQEALVRWKSAVEATGALSSASIGDHSFRGEFQSSLSLPFHPAWFCFTGERDTWATARNYWIEDQERVDVYNGRGWTDEKVEQTIEGLLEVKSRTLADSFEYSYLTVFGEKTKRVNYTYLEREERYALSETTLTGLQAELQERMATASAEAKRLLSDIYDELSEIVKPLLRLGVWFKPDLKPSPRPRKAYREFDPTPGKLPSYRDYIPIIGTGWTREAGEMLTNWPLLAKHPQPTIGEKRTVKGWTRHGVWYLWKHNNALDWLDKWRQTLKELCEQRRVEQLAYQGQVSSMKQQLNELKASDEETRREIKARYQKIEHRKEHVGEQPVVEEKTRTSITRQELGLKSTTESIHETPFFEWADERDQTYDQKRDEIANELSNLSKFTARVKIATGEKLLEHTIRTFEPGRGVGRVALQERIRRIQSDNRDHGYCQKREDVEDAILQRQAQCSQQPDEPHDAIYRRQQR
jgi:hypothetical protein